MTQHSHGNLLLAHLPAYETAAEGLRPIPDDSLVHCVQQRLRRDGFAVVDLLEEIVASHGTRIRVETQVELAERGRVQDAWRASPAVRLLACHPQLLEILRAVFGREPIPFQTLNFRVGTQQRLHSDAAHFHSVPANFLCAVWVALEDVDDDNGPVCVVPGSHERRLLTPQDFGLEATADNYPAFEQAVDAFARRIGVPLPLRLRRGQAVIWTANLLHGGAAIRDATRTRWSQVTHYFFDDCLYYAPQRSDWMRGDLRLRDVVNIRDGRTVRHRYLGQTFAPTGTQEFWMRPTAWNFIRGVYERAFPVVRNRCWKR